MLFAVCSKVESLADNPDRIISFAGAKIGSIVSSISCSCWSLDQRMDLKISYLSYPVKKTGYNFSRISWFFLSCLYLSTNAIFLSSSFSSILWKASVYFSLSSLSCLSFIALLTAAWAVLRAFYSASESSPHTTGPAMSLASTARVCFYS